jgi:crystallin alpha B
MQHLATVCESAGGFTVSLDVHQFDPREITVKTIERSIVVEGRHEERPDDHGYVTRHFVRRYVLPEEYDADHVACAISSDGILTIAAPKVCNHK